jgi:hypothetical protein
MRYQQGGGSNAAEVREKLRRLRIIIGSDN